MTRNVDALLVSIDSALADYETSVDAMRWTPDPKAAYIPAAQQFVDYYYEYLRQAAECMTQVIRDVLVPALQRLGNAMHQTITRAFSGYLRFRPVVVSRVDAAHQRHIATQMRICDRRRARRHRRRARINLMINA